MGMAETAKQIASLVAEIAASGGNGLKSAIDSQGNAGSRNPDETPTFNSSGP